jgi:tripartite-type tricarboxylate transporter receptor subunit TctC
MKPAAPAIRSLVLRSVLVLVALGRAVLPATAQAPEDDFKGKSIRILIGQPAGGGYDAYARLFARFLPRFLPGHPSIVAQNMPGAGSILMANYIYAQAPRDGTVIGLGGGTIATAALFGAAGARFDSREFSFVGSMSSEVGVTVSWHQSAVKSTDDLFAQEFVVAGAGATSDSVVFPNAVNKVLATRFKIIPGYQGSAEMALAMERGEVQGIGNWHYSSIVATHPDWLRDKKLFLILQLGLGRHADLPDVPTVLDVARNDDEKEVLRLVFAQQSIGRPIFGPPGMASEPLRLLRGAFHEMMRDPQFLTEAERDGVEINDPMQGEDVRQLIERLYVANPELVRKASAAVASPGAGSAN